ncbi:MAG: methyltransferase domain-containing protein [Thermoplasmata archaeon]|nr:methyltransferase domain-containing protein [Candidatus Sysuiplasma jiujiangense]
MSLISDKEEITEKQSLINGLKEAVAQEDLKAIKREIANIISNLKKSSKNAYPIEEESCSKLGMSFDSVIENLEQALGAYTPERSRYYLNRLIKTLTTEKIGRINDLDMNRWKDYKDIITDSLWVMEKRDRTGAHNAGYWGNFIPQIPQQLLKRYTKKNDWVLDTFVGSGTTLIECRRFGRNAIGIDLSKDALESARLNLSRENNTCDVKIEFVNADSTTVSYRELLQKYNISSVQLVIMHPPYWDIIKFSENDRDLSNAASVEVFLAGIRQIAEGVYQVLDKGRYLAVVIGDKYSKGELIPLGFYTMNEIMKVGFKLKSTVVKNFEMTKGKQSQQELWRYRALIGGFYVFKHEYIFLFER